MQSYSKFLQENLKKIILFGVPIFYFLMAVSFYLITYDSAQIKISILHVIGLFLIMSWLVLKIEQGANFDFLKKNFIFIFPVILCLLSGFFSYAISPFKDASFNEVIKRFIYVSFVFILVSEFHDEKNISRIVHWLIAAAFVSTLYGLLQIIDFRFFPPPPNPGIDPFIWRQAFGSRILSTFGNPNFYGDFLITMGPIVLALFLHKRQPYLLILWILIIINTLHTYSKGAWLAMASGNFSFVLLYVFVFLRHKITKKIVIGAIIIATLIVSIGAFGIYNQSKARMDSLSFRIITWLATWDMINTHPIIGTGIGSFYVTYPAFRRPQIFYIEGKHNNESDHPENEYLEVWFDEGIIGFTIFLTLLGFVLILGIRNVLFLHQKSNLSRDGPQYLAFLQFGLIVSLISKLTHDATCVSLRFVSSGVMLWLLIGLTIAIGAFCLQNDDGTIKNKLKKPLKIILQIAVMIVFLGFIKFLAGYFYADILHSRAITYSRAGQSDIAISNYENVIKYNPTFPMSRYFKSNVHFERWKAGDSAMAEYEFLKLWKMAPNYVQSKYLAGMMYSRLFEENLIARNNYIDQGASNEMIAKQTEYVTRLFNNAVRCFNESLAIDPIYPLTYYRLSSLYAMVGELATAEKILYAHLQYPDKLRQEPHNLWDENWRERVMPEFSETYFQLGNLYANHDSFKASVDAYQNALNIYPEHLFARKNLAAVYEKMGDKDAARQQWQIVKNLAPDDPDAIRNLSK